MNTELNVARQNKSKFGGIWVAKRNILRAIVEVAFIITLFYSNLLMGEFIHSGQGFKNGFTWAFFQIFTLANFTMAFITACVAYLVVEYLRSKL